MAGNAYVESPANTFNYATDWLECAPDQATAGGNFSWESQDYVRQGYIPFNKRRSAMRYFLGFAYTDYAPPWLLHREPPSPDPEFPWLFCNSFHPSALAVSANPANPQFSPFNQSLFWTTNPQLRSTNYAVALCTVGYKALKYRILPDSAITTPSDEWSRYCYIGSDQKLDVLTADGVGYLIFAEGAGPSGAGPVAGATPFPAPVPCYLAKGDYVIEWYGLPFDYLSDDPNVFHPTKILAGMGLVNSAPFIVGDTNPVFPTGTGLLKGYKYQTFPWPVAAANPGEILLGVNLQIMIERFDPPLGAVAPIGHGHNNMPWRGKPGDATGGKFYWPTRGGGTGDPPLLGSYDFNRFFQNVNS